MSRRLTIAVLVTLAALAAARAARRPAVATVPSARSFLCAPTHESAEAPPGLAGPADVDSSAPTQNGAAPVGGTAVRGVDARRDVPAALADVDRAVRLTEEQLTPV